jgi:CPA1 family monovalent cation:H+ antiporter
MFFRTLLPLILLAAGFIGSEFLALRGVNTGLSWDNINPLIMHLCVPVILFHLGLKIPRDELQRQWRPAITYALFGGIFSILLSSNVLAALIGTSTGFPLSAAILAAVMLAISDMSAVPEVKGGLQSTDTTRQRLEIESLALGAIGGTMFTAFTVPNVAINPLFWGIEFARAALIGITLAGAGGIFLQLFWGQGKDTSYSATKLLALVASLLGLNAVVIYLDGSSTLFAVVLALSVRSIVSERFWRPINGLAVAALLIIAGASFTPGLFEDRWLAMLIGAGVVIVGRVITILPIFWLLFETGANIPTNEPWLATFAAPRGAITLALAISIPLDFSGWYTVQAIVYGGVIASMISAACAATVLHYQEKL